MVRIHLSPPGEGNFAKCTLKTEYRKRRQIEVCEEQTDRRIVEDERNASFNQKEWFFRTAGNCITISEKEPICETHVRNEFAKAEENSSSEKEHKENALALGADEGRDKLR